MKTNQPANQPTNVNSLLRHVVQIIKRLHRGGKQRLAQEAGQLGSEAVGQTAHGAKHDA